MSVWDDLDKEASVDDRIGNHDFTVDKVTSGEWPSGDKYYELDGRLVTAHNFNLRQRISPGPTEAEVVANKGSWDTNMKKAKLVAHQNDEVLEKEYGTSLDKIKAGDTFRVKTDYQTDRNDKSKKYIRLVRFLPKTEALSSNGSDSNVPF